MGFCLFPDIHIAVGSCNCLLPLHLPQSQLSSCPLWAGVVFEGTPWGSLFGKQIAGTFHWRLAHSLGFGLTNLSVLHKEDVNQFDPANQKQELNGPLTRPPKQEAGDSPCCHERGTDLLHRTLRRLAPAKATGETTPHCALIIRLHLQVEPTWTTKWWMS